MKSRYWRKTHKFGIRVPKSVPEALQIDEDTGTTYWWDAIKKEMDKVMVAFDVEEELTADDVRQGVARGDFVGYQGCNQTTVVSEGQSILLVLCTHMTK